MRTKTWGIAAGAFLATSCGTPPSQTYLNQQPGQSTAALALDADDIRTLQQAVSGLALQIAMAELVPTHSDEGAVQNLAHAILSLSVRGQKEIAAQAHAKGATVDLTLRPADAAPIESLATLRQKAFDAAYLQMQAQRLEAALDEVQAALQRGTDTDVHDFVERSTPEIEALLRRVRAVQTA